NLGKATFEDATRRAGLGVENRFVSWGAGIVDLDNNGLPDLFIVTGNVYAELEKHFAKYPLRSQRLLFRNLGKGRFEELLEEAGPAIADPHVSRGCAFGDFDNDGDLDILIVNLNEPPSLLRNDVTSGNHWLKVKLVGTKSNRSAIGARVVVKVGEVTQTQELSSQSSFLSCNDFRLHFGLGSAIKAEIQVRWPNGIWQTLAEVPADRLVTIKEGIESSPMRDGNRTEPLSPQRCATPFRIHIRISHCGTVESSFCLVTSDRENSSLAASCWLDFCVLRR
ncbi:MAG: hypothetical protein DMG55_12285, partial [Acidobacteria bacterium]